MMDQNGFDAVLVDFTNPDAVDWYADVIAQDVLGLARWASWPTSGRRFRSTRSSGDGDPLLVHNQYPQLWASVVREGCDRAGQPDCMAFMRSAFLGSAEQVPMMWAGDQMVNYADQDGWPVPSTECCPAVSGSPLWHSDIGGYTSINAVVKNYVRPPNSTSGGRRCRRSGHDAHSRRQPAAPSRCTTPPTPALLRGGVADLRRVVPVPQDGDRRGGGHRCPGDAPDLDGLPRHGRTMLTFSSSSASTC